MGDSRRLLLVTGLVAIAAGVGCGGGDDGNGSAAKLQTVSFQKPTEDGPDPFTKPTEKRGPKKVKVGSGPFGGTGSDLVCDRDVLIRSLRARPDRLREWARIAGVRPTYRAVARYIAKLHPVTLTRDTRVTNHSFVNGRAVPYQAILQAGTAVLVDKFGKPVARCRCGNPLTEPVFIPTAKCLHCPANYKPPPPCKYRRDPGYDEEYDSHEDYDRAYYRSRSSSNPCYSAYPDPPTVTVITVYRAPPEEPAPQEPAPAPEPEPEPALNCEAPRSQLEAEQCAERQGPQPQPEEPQPEPQQPTGPACSDGIDNDSGGEIDYPNDSGCSSPEDPSEE